MRLILTFKNPYIALPVRYKHLIQGWIYSLFQNSEFGQFLHDTGYQADGKKFKMFVYSDLMGTFTVAEDLILYKGETKLEIASLSDPFITALVSHLQKDPKIILGSQILEVAQLKMETVPYFKGEKDLLIRTISPVTAYRSVEGKFEYFIPGSPEFEEICLQNLQRKNEALFSSKELSFHITEVIKAQKRIVYFKNTFYCAYKSVMRIRCDYRALDLILNTGLSSKGSAGFGMIEILHE